ncbi:MAG: hypothetical protein JNM94_01150, partial [Phycisphaerae bacterium]|nr:hypothetical protein [Phycisphaerae bacterium]
MISRTRSVVATIPVTLAATLLVAGCRAPATAPPAAPAPAETPAAPPSDAPPPVAPPLAPEPAPPVPVVVAPPPVIRLPSGIEVDRAKGEVRVPTFVACREGFLEQIACLAGTREHESLLVTEIKPSDV